MTEEQFQTIVESLKKFPETVGQLVSGLPDKVLTSKPHVAEFSIVEHICHLRDIEKEGYAVRIEKLLTEIEPFLADIDGNKLAEERDYNQQDVRAALIEFILARNNNVQVIEGLSLVQLSRCGMFENVGPVTLERLLLLMRGHDEEHLKELTDLRGRLVIDR